MPDAIPDESTTMKSAPSCLACSWRADTPVTIGSRCPSGEGEPTKDSAAGAPSGPPPRAAPGGPAAVPPPRGRRPGAGPPGREGSGREGGGEGGFAGVDPADQQDGVLG